MTDQSGKCRIGEKEILFPQNINNSFISQPQEYLLVCWWSNFMDKHTIDGKVLWYYLKALFSVIGTIKNLELFSAFCIPHLSLSLPLSLFSLSVAPSLPKYAPPNSSSSPEDYFSIRHVYSGILARLERNPLREELKEEDPPSGIVWTSYYSLFFIFLNYASALLTLVTGGWPGSCLLWFEGSNCWSVVRKQ